MIRNYRMQWGKVILPRITFILLFIMMSFGVYIQPARAACTITGVVYRDYNDNGQQEALEPGEGGVEVRAYDAAGSLVDTATTADDGTYTLTLPTDGEVRIEFTWPMTFLYSARFGANSGTTIRFVECNGAVPGVSLGLSQPSQFCHTNAPDLGTSCYVFEDQLRGPFADSPAFVTFPYTATGDQAHPVLALASQIGTTWGLGYHRASDSFFVASYLKRHTGFGPNASGTATTTGGIYRMRPSTGQVSLFLDLNTLPAAFNTGADPHPASTTDCPPNFFDNCWQYDTDTYNLVSKMSLGDLDISEDDRSIYVVNLNTRELLDIPIGYDATVPPASRIRRYSLTGLPGQTCSSSADVRPFGLGVHDGRVYVGSVCSAETSQNPNDLRAFVHSFDPLAGGGFRLELTFPLAYPRGCADQSDVNCPLNPFTGRDRSAQWRPWNPNWPNPDNEANVYAEPLLSDIVFDNQNMVIGIRDRFGDRAGRQQPGPFDLTSGQLSNGITAGDVLRACRDASGAWALEANGSCGGITTGGAGNGEGPGGGEYYFHDRNNPNIPADGPARHDEISLGGLVDIPGSPEMAMTVFDPLCENCGFPDALFDGGVVWLNHNTGTRFRSFRIFDGPSVPPPPPGLIEQFGKSNGLGDLEAVCGPAPLEIGNLVWEDLDLNGVQDPGELKLANVSLRLYMDTDGDGTVDTLIAQTITDADGEYYFNEQNIYFAGLFPPGTPGINFVDINGNGVRDDFEPIGLLPDTAYEVRLDDPANYNGGPLTPYYATRANTRVLNDGNDDFRDSDGVNPRPRELVSETNFPVTALTTRLYGDNDHTFDFGFALQPPPSVTPTPPPGTPGTPGAPGTLGISKTPDDPFAEPGKIVSWTITVTNDTDTPATNVVVEDRVPDELEIVPPLPPSATVSGQLVTVTFDLIPPRSSASVTITTRVRDDVQVPFIIVNPAGIIGGPATEASVISVQRLPETGETPLIRWVILGGALVIVLAGGWLLLRRLGRA
ncbi:MAG: DUF11 domain-containing protein [Chloroflexi bacterium]|nr:DUF11 domain-containing protein [Chloroflexota bacterium]MDL1884367.1 DUF11 domain-containing protein [Anaerolineae bacterium CFX8]